MSCQVLDVPDVLQHLQLRNNGHCFQVNAESPDDFKRSELLIEQERKDEARRNQVQDVFERVCLWVVGDFVRLLGLHQVNYVCSGEDEAYFHYGVVEGDEVQEQVYVAAAEHQQVDFLGLAT